MNKIKNNLDKEIYYTILENKELKENNHKLNIWLEELEQKLKEKNIDVIIIYIDFIINN